MDKEFVLTEDGSHTIYLPEIDEHYHSVHGAIQESMHVFITAGLLYSSKSELNVLEIGFGTGLNAYLTFCQAKEMKRKINYYSIEKYPLQPNQYQKLNYSSRIFSENKTIFLKMHEADWNESSWITDDFNLFKIQADLIEFDFSAMPLFDLVYYDAFAPGKQPEMWTDTVLQRVVGSISQGGILVTYCAKGSVRRAFQSAGLIMERIPGPPGKKEMLRGKKPD